MRKPETLTVETWRGGRGSLEVTVTQVENGTKREHRGKRSYQKRTITVGRVFEVTLTETGEVLGYVGYRMFTREQRTPGRMYVNSRWESPGWAHGSTPSYQRWEGSSKKDCVERLANEYLEKRLNAE